MSQPPLPHHKTMSQFLPVSTRSPESCSEHYVQVHSRWARHMLRSKPQVVSYHIARATAEHDLLGTWAGAPSAFWFNTLRYQAGRSLETTDLERATINHDQRRFLRDLRTFDVAEEVLVDELRGQTALVKYVFEFDRDHDTTPAAADVALTEVCRDLAAAAAECFGLRQLVMNRVRAEFAADLVDEPGQRLATAPLPASTRVGLAELYVDQPEWAEEWLGSSKVLAILRDRFARTRGSRVEESCGLDRR